MDDFDRANRFASEVLADHDHPGRLHSSRFRAESPPPDVYECPTVFADYVRSELPSVQTHPLHARFFRVLRRTLNEQFKSSSSHSWNRESDVHNHSEEHYELSVEGSVRRNTAVLGVSDVDLHVRTFRTLQVEVPCGGGPRRGCRVVGAEGDGNGGNGKAGNLDGVRSGSTVFDMTNNKDRTPDKQSGAEKDAAVEERARQLERTQRFSIERAQIRRPVSNAERERFARTLQPALIKSFRDDGDEYTLLNEGVNPVPLVEVRDKSIKVTLTYGFSPKASAVSEYDVVFLFQENIPGAPSFAQPIGGPAFAQQLELLRRIGSLSGLVGLGTTSTSSVLPLRRVEFPVFRETDDPDEASNLLHEFYACHEGARNAVRLLKYQLWRYAHRYSNLCEKSIPGVYLEQFVKHVAEKFEKGGLVESTHPSVRSSNDFIWDFGEERLRRRKLLTKDGSGLALYKAAVRDLRELWLDYPIGIWGLWMEEAKKKGGQHNRWISEMNSSALECYSVLPWTRQSRQIIHYAKQQSDCCSLM